MLVLTRKTPAIFDIYHFLYRLHPIPTPVSKCHNARAPNFPPPESPGTKAILTQHLCNARINASVLQQSSVRSFERLIPSSMSAAIQVCISCPREILTRQMCLSILSAMLKIASNRFSPVLFQHTHPQPVIARAFLPSSLYISLCQMSSNVTSCSHSFFYSGSILINQADLCHCNVDSQCDNILSNPRVGHKPLFSSFLSCFSFVLVFFFFASGFLSHFFFFLSAIFPFFQKILSYLSRFLFFLYQVFSSQLLCFPSFSSLWFSLFKWFILFCLNLFPFSSPL